MLQFFNATWIKQSRTRIRPKSGDKVKVQSLFLCILANRHPVQ
jgi:hypothetical protein